MAVKKKRKKKNAKIFYVILTHLWLEFYVTDGDDGNNNDNTNNNDFAADDYDFDDFDCFCDDANYYDNFNYTNDDANHDNFDDFDSSGNGNFVDVDFVNNDGLGNDIYDDNNNQKYQFATSVITHENTEVVHLVSIT